MRRRFSIDTADLSQYDLSGAQLVRFEIKRKDKSLNLRLSEELYDAVGASGRPARGCPINGLFA